MNRHKRWTGPISPEMTNTPSPPLILPSQAPAKYPWCQKLKIKCTWPPILKTVIALDSLFGQGIVFCIYVLYKFFWNMLSLIILISLSMGLSKYNFLVLPAIRTNNNQIWSGVCISFISGKLFVTISLLPRATNRALGNVPFVARKLPRKITRLQWIIHRSAFTVRGSTEMQIALIQ